MKSKVLLLLLIAFMLNVYSQSSAIQVSGKKIIGVCGDTIILRGINYAPFNWGWDRSQDYFSEIAKTGANCVRIVWYSNDADAGGTLGVYNNIANLDTAIGKCIKNKMIAILELHDISCDSSNSKLISLSNWYLSSGVKAIISKYAHNLIINIANEALYVQWSAYGPATSLAHYKSTYETIFNNFRNAGINVPLMIDAPDCGTDLTDLASIASALETSDPKQNIIFSAHAYWLSDPTSTITNALTQNVPFILGEVANYQGNTCDNLINYKPTLELCQSNYVGWLAWSWNNDECSSRQISKDSTYTNLSAFGKDIVNNSTYGLKNHSLLTSYLANNQVCNTANLSGILTYDNSESTPIDNVEVDLETPEGTIIQKTTSNAEGKYIFYTISNGSYNVIPIISKTWGGANPVDALMVNRNYIKVYYFSDNLLKLAGDVNSDLKINPVDALLINRRYIKSINSFKAGDWLYPKDTLKISGNAIIYNFRAVCFGDVNGSYVPNSK